jgi:hypothetical protein
MKVLEQFSNATMKVAKGMLAIFMIKLIFVLGVFIFQSCESETIVNDTAKQEALSKFENLVKKQTIEIQSIKQKSEQGLIAKSNVSDEQFAMELLQPIINGSKDLLEVYNITDADIQAELGNTNDPRIAIVALAVLQAETNSNEVTMNFASLFGTSAYAQSAWECAGQALGFYAIAEIFAGQVSNSAILGAFRKVAARTLGWIGLGLAVYEFGDCMGYW